jgi:hypothetical protein
VEQFTQVMSEYYKQDDLVCEFKDQFTMSTYRNHQIYFAAIKQRIELLREHGMSYKVHDMPFESSHTDFIIERSDGAMIYVQEKATEQSKDRISMCKHSGKILVPYDEGDNDAYWIKTPDGIALIPESELINLGVIKTANSSGRVSVAYKLVKPEYWISNLETATKFDADKFQSIVDSINPAEHEKYNFAHIEMEPLVFQNKRRRGPLAKNIKQ